MDFTVKEDLELEKKFAVGEEHTAKFLGSGDVEVFATPAMIAFMEHTCRVAADSELPEGFTTVGTKVCISHLAAAPKGASIRVHCKLKRQEGKKLVFDVEAWWNNTKVGAGEHERFIINRKKFLEKLRA